jgi:hypothetical protein
MTTMTAIVRNGQLELPGPIDLPDGTEVEVLLPERAGTDSGTEEVPPEGGWSNSPEAITDWLKWYDSLEPLILTPEEEAEAEAWLRKMNDYAIANMDPGTRGVFP